MSGGDNGWLAGRRSRSSSSETKGKGSRLVENMVVRVTRKSFNDFYSCCCRGEVLVVLLAMWGRVRGREGD